MTLWLIKEFLISTYLLKKYNKLSGYIYVVNQIRKYTVFYALQCSHKIKLRKITHSVKSWSLYFILASKIDDLKLDLYIAMVLLAKSQAKTTITTTRHKYSILAQKMVTKMFMKFKARSRYCNGHDKVWFRRCKPSKKKCNNFTVWFFYLSPWSAFKIDFFIECRIKVKEKILANWLFANI